MPELSGASLHRIGGGWRGGLMWLVAGFAVLFGLAALAVPALVSGGLIVRGIADGFPSWVALGGVVGGMWSLMLVGTVRKATGARARRAAAPPAPDPARH